MNSWLAMFRVKLLVSLTSLFRLKNILRSVDQVKPPAVLTLMDDMAISSPLFCISPMLVRYCPSMPEVDGRVMPYRMLKVLAWYQSMLPVIRLFSTPKSSPTFTVLVYSQSRLALGNA